MLLRYPQRDGKTAVRHWVRAQREGLGWRFKPMGHLHKAVMHKEDRNVKTEEEEWNGGKLRS